MIMDDLLGLLREINIPVPKVTKTLAKMPKSLVRPTDMPPGKFVYFGIQNMLTKINNPSLRDASEIVITVSSDGIPLYKSSKSQLIPITGHVVGIKHMSQFPIGVYHGIKKPSLNDYLKDLCEEYPRLMRDGVLVTNDEIRKPFSLLFFSGDAPQRAWMAGVKGHTSKNGCHMCDQVAKKINNTLTFSTTRGEPRTDESFTARSCPDHHQPEFLNEPSPLEASGIGMVTQIPLESMHLIDRGVTGKTVKAIWNNKCLIMDITDEVRTELEYKVLQMRNCIPRDFPRKCRTFVEICNWKATEFRLFALYTSVVILRDSVREEMYDHFLHLVCAYRLICAKDARINADTANILFERFVENYPFIYGENKVSYNIHNILHICECVKRYGPVSEFAAYKNENYLHQMKKYVRKPTQVLQQIVNRVEEMCTINNAAMEEGFIFGTDNKFPNCLKSYNGYRFDNFILKANSADAYCEILPNIKFEIQQFSMINNEKVVFGKQFLKTEPFFTMPMNSEEVGIFKCSNLSSTTEIFPLSKIGGKFMKLPYGNSSILIALLHHL